MVLEPLIQRITSPCAASIAYFRMGHIFVHRIEKNTNGYVIELSLVFLEHTNLALTKYEKQQNMRGFKIQKTSNHSMPTNKIPLFLLKSLLKNQALLWNSVLMVLSTLAAQALPTSSSCLHKMEAFNRLCTCLCRDT